VKRRWIIRRFAQFALLAVITQGCNSRTTEPVYAGKTISEWLNAGHEDSCQAVHEIGPPALPFILDKLAREDPQFGSNSPYFKIWRGMPGAIRRVLPRPGSTNFDEDRACNTLLELGPAVIVDLTQTLTSPNRAVREVSAHVLGVLKQRGKNIGVAVQALEAASCDSCPQVANRAKWALRGLQQSYHD
jgi:hypothetical protein